jgi:glycosyltransferase involved in cell wall biosynthesis
MKIAIALLTYNRQQLFLRTLNSIYNAWYPYNLSIFDNGSTDGTAQIVKGIGGEVNTTDNHTTGYGMNRVIEMAMKHNPDVIVFTADDFYYRKLWLKKLVSFLDHAPADIVLTSCYLEPMWHWNQIGSIGEAGGERYAIRASLPGSNWVFRAKDIDKIYPIAEKTGGEDLEICGRLRGNGLRLAALDLVKHTGEEQSAWGNESYKYAKPLDLNALGFAEWHEYQ